MNTVEVRKFIAELRKNRETLQFIGERYWTEKYSWREV